MAYVQRSKTSDAPFRRDSDPRSLPQPTQVRRGKARAPVNPDLGREPGLELVRERPDDTLSPGHPQVLETPESLSDSLYDSLSSCGSQGWERAPVAERMGIYRPSGTNLFFFFYTFTLVTSGSIKKKKKRWALAHKTRTLLTPEDTHSVFLQEVTFLSENFLLDESQRRSVEACVVDLRKFTAFLLLCPVLFFFIII